MITASAWFRFAERGGSRPERVVGFSDAAAAAVLDESGDSLSVLLVVFDLWRRRGLSNWFLLEIETLFWLLLKASTAH